MAGFTMGTSWLSLTRTAAAYRVAGLLFRMYLDHFGTIPVAVGGVSPQPAPKWPVGGDQPRVNAGSPTYPLDVVAALSADGASLSVAVINATETVQPLALDLQGFRAGPQGRAWTMSGTSLAATNRVGEAPQVAVRETAFDTASAPLPMAPYSIGMHVFPRAG
jgi:alpha-N-arabinofuranosidase